MDCLTVLGFGACTPLEELRARLPIPAGDIDRSCIPPLLRRRTSQATQMAFSAAHTACMQAQRSPADLPAVFASVAGEIQVTDQLCIELAKADGIISPTAFHNSVHNTAAAYWSIVHGCTEAVTAMAAGHESFAMALLDAWCRLATHNGELLLVCYDERWPYYLAAPVGEPPFAFALVLAAGEREEGIARLGRPACSERPAGTHEDFAELAATLPIAAGLPLLRALHEGQSVGTINLGAGWAVAISAGQHSREGM